MSQPQVGEAAKALAPNDSFVARQPIVDAKKDLFGFELLFRDSWENRFPDVSSDEATSRLIVDSQLESGLEGLVGSRPAFINFPERPLLEKFPQLFSTDAIVIEVLESVQPNDAVVKACAEMHEQGYRIALDDFSDDRCWQAILPHVDIVKVDISDYTPEGLEALVGKPHLRGKRLLAERVETLVEFEYCAGLGFELFQGYFLARPEVVKSKKVSANKLSMMQLLAETAKSPMDFDAINKLIAQDGGLSIKLLKFINSPYFGVVANITSLSHALAYLGEEQMRKFISLLSMASLGADKSPALLGMAVARARFCELLAEETGGCDTGAAFLSGLFSLIEAVTDESLEQVFAKLPLDPAIKLAVEGDESHLAKVLALAIAYEKGHWLEVQGLSAAVAVSQHELLQIYTNALTWAVPMEEALGS
jgi:EAL and modified HD-GYP domain-containing signal transduction protein